MENLFLPEEAEQAAGVPDAVVMEPIIGMEDPWRYRNKAQYPIGRGKDGKPTAGFFAGRTHSLIPVLGHRDPSPDLDGDGIVDPEEWTKLCPCFAVGSEYPFVPEIVVKP